MYLDLKVSKDTLINIENLFTWGNEHKEIISKKFPQFASRIISTGTPRFDLFEARYIKIFDENVRQINSKYHDFTLICGSFSFVNHFTSNINYLNVLKSQNVIKNFVDEKNCKILQI